MQSLKTSITSENFSSRSNFINLLKLVVQLEAWARDGLTDEQIAANIGIHRDTLNEWKKKYSDISDTLKRGKEIVDIQVVNYSSKLKAVIKSYCEQT